jgi:hypothetical protein
VNNVYTQAELEQGLLASIQRSGLSLALKARLRTVPVLGICRLGELGTVDDVLRRAIGLSLNPTTSREGLVFVSLVDGTSIKLTSSRH